MARIQADNWLIRTDDRTVRANIRCINEDDRIIFRLSVADGGIIPNLTLKLGPPEARMLYELMSVSSIDMEVVKGEH